MAVLTEASHSTSVGESARTREIAFDNQLLAVGLLTASASSINAEFIKMDRPFRVEVMVPKLNSNIFSGQEAAGIIKAAGTGPPFLT